MEKPDEQERARALRNRDHTGTVEAAHSKPDNSRNAATVDSTTLIKSMTELKVVDVESACPIEEFVRGPSTASAVTEETKGDDAEHLRYHRRVCYTYDVWSVVRNPWYLVKDTGLNFLT
jgi:hypothetical protein